MNAKLTETQTAVLNVAASRTDGNIEPLLANLRGGARTQFIKGLLAKGLVVESDGRHLLTDAGYTAVGKHRTASNGVAKRDTTDALTKREATHALQKLEASSRTTRPGTKLAALVTALRHPGGATIAQIMAGTGWQAHSVRGAISGMLRKRLGLNVVLARNDSGERVYRVV